MTQPFLKAGRIPPNEEALAFPICPSDREFNNSARHIRPLSKKLRDIIESVQPYKAPKLEPHLMVFNFNRALGILHDWARKDRHRTLHVVGSWASNVRPKLRIPDGTSLAHMTVHTGRFLENESEIATFKIVGYTRGMNVEGNPDTTIDIAVNEIPPPCADNDTFENRLKAMIVATGSIIGTFEKNFGLSK